MKLSIVVPCYNEEKVLEETARRLRGVLDALVEKRKIASDSFILFVNDGSRDATWLLIERLYAADPHICGLSLAQNSGHQNALMAGLAAVMERCDAAVSIDADLQDDTAVIEDMVDAFAAGADIVYGVRRTRKSDTFFKRTTAQAFYRLMSWLGVRTVYNHADFRLMSRRALRQLAEYPERNLFLRGIIPTIGYKTATVFYDRHERFAGESKYPLFKMLNFAIDGITSFSVKPIRLIASMGFIILFITLVMAGYTLVSFFCGETVEGWASLMLSLWFLGSVILIAIGTIGEYIGKIYVEVKRRPRYNIETFLYHDESSK